MDNRVRHTPLSKHEASRRLTALKRGFGLTTVVGFGVLGALTFPHGIQAPASQAPGTPSAAGTAAGTNPAAPSGNVGSATSPDGGDAIGGFFSAVGSALFGNDGQGQNQIGQGQDQTGQGGYGFGPANSGGAPATGSGVS
jgi:hypothetical protein